MSGTRTIVISADGHCGADLLDYRPYLEERYQEEFDSWAAEFSDGWSTLGDGDRDDDRRVGVASIGVSVNWDSAERQRATDAQGIAAEVLFPNTAPPFFPSGAITAAAPGRPPQSRREYEYRFAGVRAHNRWLGEFCAQTPGRRAGIGQVFLSELDDTLDEVKRIRESGLMGVLLPGDHHQQLQPLYDRDLDPLWSLCADLELPVGRHGLFVTEPNSEQNCMAAGAIGLLESRFFTQRALGTMIISGVFERHPRLKFVVTEVGAAWIVDYLSELDAFVREARRDGTLPSMFAGELAGRLTRLPSEYFATNCYVGSFLDGNDMRAAPRIGTDRIMWGADFPHHEGTSPFTREALRANLSNLTIRDSQRILASNAADCYGFDLDLLANVAESMGPTLEDLTRPLTPDEWPTYPSQTVCATFRTR